MIIILNNTTKKVISNWGTCTSFPDGNIPIEVNENELAIRLHDDSDFSKLIQTSFDYDLELDENNEVIGVTVNKTLEQYWAEQPVVIPPKTELQLAQEQIIKLQQMNKDISADFQGFQDFFFIVNPELA